MISIVSILVVVVVSVYDYY